MRLEQRCSRAYFQFCGSNKGIVHQFDAQCTTPRGPGQTHLNSDAKIADEGRPQGAPLPIVFSRRYALRRAPTRGAPTDCLLQALCLEKGTHKGRPYRLSSLGVMPWGGHPQGAPLPFVFSRRYALGRAPTRGAPTNCLLQAKCLGEGAHKGRPYRLSSLRRYALGRAPTRGAPTICLLQALCPGKGTHKGRPYQLSSLGVMPWGGHPQGAPLPIVFSRRYALGRAPTRGAPTICLLQALCLEEGRPQGAPLPDSGSLTWVCPNLMQLPCRLPARKIATRPLSTNVSTRGVVVRNRRSQ